MRPVSWKEFDKFLRYIGCTFDHQTGDHLIYKKDGLNRPIVIKKVNELPIFIVNNNLRTLNMTKKDFLEILERL